MSQLVVTANTPRFRIQHTKPLHRGGRRGQLEHFLESQKHTTVPIPDPGILCCTLGAFVTVACRDVLIQGVLFAPFDTHPPLFVLGEHEVASAVGFLCGGEASAAFGGVAAVVTLR